MATINDFRYELGKTLRLIQNHDIPLKNQSIYNPTL